MPEVSSGSDRDHLDSDQPIYVSGHTGLVGSAVLRRLRAEGFTRILVRRSSQLDLRNRDATRRFLTTNRPEAIVLAAARVGGIAANSAAPADFLSDNLRIQLSVLDAARELRVPRVLFLGSSCVYPRDAPQPIRESALLTGPLEVTNEAYAIAKIAGLIHVRGVRAQDGLPWISAMPTNLYGPNDNFHTEHSHVLPALIRRFHDARVRAEPVVRVWGTGRPRREFLHADDLARACLTLLRHYDGDQPVNVGTGQDLPIADLAGSVADAVGYRGEIAFDEDRPDGTPRKVLDISRLSAMGWRPTISLADGVTATYQWYLDNREHVRR
ncbi:MAG: GDP-L-fucose synthase [Actinophytocola sp.]|uniref:GDP-L-fucose synthase family protein n=1 Tax=Actinophytocola sp. TaxID=1872138 RepID=UPI003C7570DC